MELQAVRRRYRTELQQALDSAGGKTRKRTYRAMLRAVAERRGAELKRRDDEVLVWSDLHLGDENIIEYQRRPFFDHADMDTELRERCESVLTPESALVLVEEARYEKASATPLGRA